MRYDLTTPVIVYAITCIPTGKEYIGITMKTLEWRWNGHCKEAKASRFDTVLYRAMRLYGAENFSISQIQVAANGQVAQLIERELIISRGTLAPYGLNSSTGGEQWAGREMTQEVKDKISAAKKGRKLNLSDEARQKMVEERKNRRHSDETKAKMRVAQARPDIKEAKSERGKKLFADPTMKEKMRAAREIPEAIQRHHDGLLAAAGRTSASQKARHANPANWIRIKEGQRKSAMTNLGRPKGPMAEATKAKIGAANKAIRAAKKLAAAQNKEVA